MSLRTTLYNEHLALNARIIEFGGWDMPVQYEGIINEHNAVRTDVGLFDTSHMAVFAVDGAGSLDALSAVVTQDLRTLAIGACRYGFMLNDAGGVIDDLIVYRMGETSWMPVVNAGTAANDLAWLQRHCQGAACQVRDLRGLTEKIDLQGPATVATLKKTLGIDIAGLRRFRWMRHEALGFQWIISRTGYTGEDGVELYGAPDALVAAWRAFVGAGVKPCGLGARDTLRLEAGYPLYGHELDLNHSPAEANLLRYAKKAEPFIGREALRQRAASPAVLLTPFLLEGRQSARHGQRVCDSSGANLGVVTSGTFAPTVGRAIGFAYVAPAAAAAGTQWRIDNGRAMLPAVAGTLPFLSKAGN